MPFVRIVPTLQAGRELDTLVAQKVMGWHINISIPDFRHGALHHYDPVHRTSYLPEQWCPSESIETAWQVVEKLGNWHGFTFLIVKDEGKQYRAGWSEAGWDGYEDRAIGEADTVPLAICIAALKAVGVDQP